jgi:hypothetical protein
MTTNVTKAQLWKLDPKGKLLNKFDVQFNPETLKVTFTNQLQPANQNSASDNSRGTSATQYVGRGTTKLSVTLWFDVNAEVPDGLAKGDPHQRSDVRKLTAKVIDLIRPQKKTANLDQQIPPAVRFVWGSFQFDGIAESIEQSLEFFSPTGVPLRASITLSLTQQSIQYEVADPNAGGKKPATRGDLPSGAPPGTSPLTAAPAGATLQSLAGAVGQGSNWQAIAQANGIENPRLLAPGQLVDMNAGLPGQ